MKRKVLFFIQNKVGGAERMSVLIGKSLDTKNYSVCYYIIGHNSNSQIKDFIPLEYEIVYINYKNTIQLIIYILRCILKEKPYAVFSSVININNKYLPFRWLFPRTKTIIRSDNYLYTYTKKQRCIVKLLYPMADIIVAQTQEMEKELIDAGINKEKIVTLLNPIDTETINLKTEKASNPYPHNGMKKFVASGRFAYQKGFDLLVQSFGELAKHRNDVELYIIGDYKAGNETVYNKLKKLAEEKGVSKSVHYVGYLSNPYPYIMYADSFVLSSRWEGLPNVLIEALYLRTPVAAFKCVPVIERIVSEGNNGFLAEKEDVSSLCQAMEKSLTLGRVVSTYKSSKPEDFAALFV